MVFYHIPIVERAYRAYFPKEICYFRDYFIDLKKEAWNSVERKISYVFGSF